MIYIGGARKANLGIRPDSKPYKNDRVIEMLNIYDFCTSLSIITSQLHCSQLRTTLNEKDFKFFSHGLCTEKQNILLQHMRDFGF